MTYYEYVGSKGNPQNTKTFDYFTYFILGLMRIPKNILAEHGFFSSILQTVLELLAVYCFFTDQSLSTFVY